MSEIDEKWIFYKDNYAYIRLEKLYTCSGKSLYDRENRATLSKKISIYYINIDDLCIYTDNETIFKPKKEYIDLLDKINNKINNITDVKKIIKKIKDELNDKIVSIYEIIFNLSNDSRLRQDELNKVDAIIDDTLNFIYNNIYRKNINRDKQKDIDEYALSNRLEFLETMFSSINNKISKIEDKIDMIHYDMYTEDGEGIDKLHSIYDKLKEFMTQLKQDLKKIFSFADLSKNKLNSVDEDRNMPIDKDKQ